MHRSKAASAFAGADALLEAGTRTRLRLAWRLFRDPRVAPRLKFAVPLVAALYLVSPIDVIPDFFLGLGQVDDFGAIGVALLVMSRVMPRMAPAAIVDEHLAAMGVPNAAEAAASEASPVVDVEYRVRR